MMRTLGKVVLLTRDEPDLIEDFLAYWGALFDPGNVVIVDNGSRDARVLRAYEGHRGKGGLIIHEPRPFRQAASFMTEHLSMIARSETCEWIFPIETDEFLFVQSVQERQERQERQEGKEEPPAAATLTDVRGALFAHLRSVPPGVGVLKYGSFWGSSVDPADPGYRRGSYARPAADIVRFHDQGWDKVVIRASAFLRMTQWCHHAECRPDYVTAKSRELGLLHFHDTGMRRAYERALPVVEGYGYLDVAHGTPSEHLRATSRLRNAPIACGHKVGYVDRHLRRRATLLAFRRHLGRLPDSPAEMLAVSDDPQVLDCSASPDALVRRELAAGRLRRRTTKPATLPPSSCSWDDLIYHETRMEHAHVVRQVSDVILAC